MLTVVYTAVYTGRGRFHGRVWAVSAVNGPCKRPCTRAVYIHSRIHGPYTAMDTTRAHSRVQDRVDGRMAVFTAGRVLGSYTAVNMACTRPCRRSCTCIHCPYTKPIEFATFSHIVVITSVNKAKHYNARHRTFTTSAQQ